MNRRIAGIVNFSKTLVRRNLPSRLLLSMNAHKHLLFGEAELRFLQTIVPRDLAAIDVGANTGVYTYWLSRQCPQVFAYEPNPELAAFLKSGVKKNVTVSGIALSDHSGSEEIVIPTVNGVEIHGWASIVDKKKMAIQGRRVQISVATLDEQEHPRIGFIKIDVEGHEGAVLRGAVGTITRHRPILLIEMEQRHMEQDISNEIREILAMGYSGHYFMNGQAMDAATFKTNVHQRMENSDGRGLYINNFLFKPLPRTSAEAGY